MLSVFKYTRGFRQVVSPSETMDVWKLRTKMKERRLNMLLFPRPFNELIHNG